MVGFPLCFLFISSPLSWWETGQWGLGEAAFLGKCCWTGGLHWSDEVTAWPPLQMLWASSAHGTLDCWGCSREGNRL